jgi:large subunit ribosomal protein L1
VNFDENLLLENVRALIQELIARKPATAKGVYIRSVSVSSTMGVGVRVDPNSAINAEEVV